MIKAWSWEQLSERTLEEPDTVNGPTNAQANLRLFGKKESDAIVTFYRDLHAWCPYCSKIWLWLEAKRVPYQVKKVTMRCYGDKESWYLDKVPSGMLPALEINGQLITESDEILLALERFFGPLCQSITSKESLHLRNLERLLFRAWCFWLCTPSLNKHEQQRAKARFREVAQHFESALGETDGPFLHGNNPGTVDLIYVPFIERMNASLAYYKGYLLRQEHPAINTWLKALEELEIYRGVQGDFHTHVHNLPPQMGSCWPDDEVNIIDLTSRIDSGEGLGILEACWPSTYQDDSIMRKIALSRVIKHKDKILSISPSGPKGFDQPLRAALTLLITESESIPDTDSDASLRYLRDRISVPRDMPLPAARLLRTALERTASLIGTLQVRPIPTTNRFDQDPKRFNQIRPILSDIYQSEDLK